MKFAISIGLLVLAVSGCGRQPQSQDSPGVDVTNVTDVAVATTPPASAEGSMPRGSDDGEIGRESTTQASGEGSPQDAPVSLNLSLPEKELGKDPDYLFAEKDNTPNYFKSSSDDARVKLKGKVYMIEEPSSEKRIENLDGGEIGIVVPLR